MNVRDLPPVATEQRDQLSALQSHAAQLPHAELAKAMDNTAVKLSSGEAEVTKLRIKLDQNKRAYALREAELAFAPSIEVAGDPDLKRLNSERDSLTKALAMQKQSVDRSRLVLQVARDELQARARKLDKLVSEAVFAEWQKTPLDEALENARAAIVDALLVYCGHRTEKLGFIDTDSFMREVLGFRTIQILANECEQDERNRQRAALVESDKHLG